MKTIIIAALSENRVIGRDNAIPWHYPADIKHFPHHQGAPSSPAARPMNLSKSDPFPTASTSSLPATPTISSRSPRASSPCLSRTNPNYPTNENVHLQLRPLPKRSLTPKNSSSSGVPKIYKQALPLADEMILTHLPIEVEGDAYFPAWDESEWEVVERRCEGELVFATYRRRR